MVVRIAFSGKMTAGKSTASAMVQMHINNCKKLSFAGKIYELARELFGMTTKDRDLLVKLGEKMREIDPNVWLNFVTNNIKDGESYVLDDLRFPNELEELKKKGFTIVRLDISRDEQIKRLKTVYPDAWEQHVKRMDNSTETALDNYDFDHIIPSYNKEDVKMFILKLITDNDLGKVTVTKKVSKETLVGFLSLRQKAVCDPTRVTNCTENQFKSTNIINNKMELTLEPTIEGVEELYKDLKGYEGDAGFDLYCPEDVIIPAKSLSYKLNLGVKSSLNENTNFGIISKSFWLAPRSSMGAKTPLRLSNSIGLIDSKYRGNLMALLDNHSDEDYVVKKGDRLVQIVPFNGRGVYKLIIDKVDETKRGENGLGSTGR